MSKEFKCSDCGQAIDANGGCGCMIDYNQPEHFNTKAAAPDVIGGSVVKAPVFTTETNYGGRLNPAAPEVEYRISETAKRASPLYGTLVGPFKDGGLRESQTVEKPRYDLITPQSQECLAKVLAFGEKKYPSKSGNGAGNWTRGLSFMDTLRAIESHTNAIKRGERIDPESNLPHACHVQANAMFMHWFLHGPTAARYIPFDDISRFISGHE